MANATTSMAGQSSAPPRQSAQALALALGWGAVMLCIMALWLAKQQPEISSAMLAPLWVAAAICAAAGLWQFQALLAGETQSRWTQRRGVFRLLLIVGGILLLAYSAWLSIAFGKSALGESLGLALFACAAVISGLMMLRPAGSPFLEQVRTSANLRIVVASLGSFVGAVFLALSLALAIIWKQDVLLGGVAAWQGDEGWRLWVCAYLGVIGLAALFFTTWVVQGEVRKSVSSRRMVYGFNAVVTGIVLLACLVVANIAFFTRFPMTWEWTKSRGLVALSPKSTSLLAGLPTDVTVYVLLSSGDESFIDETRVLLDNCQAVASRFHVVYVDPDKDFLAYQSLRERFPDIVTDARTMRADPEMSRGLLVSYGYPPDNLPDIKTKIPHAFIRKGKLVDVGGEGGPRPTRAYKGESELMRELNYLQEGQVKRKLYFLQGNEELDIDSDVPIPRFDPREELFDYGSGVLVEMLGKENYEVKGISFGRAQKGDRKDKLIYIAEGPDKKKDIPKDAYALVILGPSKEMPKETLDAIDRYLEGGGRLIATFDIVATPDFRGERNSGLETVLKKYGVEVSNDFVMQPVDSEKKDPRDLIALTPDGATTSIARQFHNKAFLLPIVRVVRPSTDTPRYKVETLLQLDAAKQDGWVEKIENGPLALADPLRWQTILIRTGDLDKRISQESIPVAVTVSEEGSKPRMVVFGDTELFSNAYIRTQRGDNFALFLSSLEWMSDHPTFVGPGPKESALFLLPQTVSPWRIAWVPGWLMFIGVMALGMAVWLVRRR